MGLVTGPFWLSGMLCSRRPVGPVGVFAFLVVLELLSLNTRKQKYGHAFEVTDDIRQLDRRGCFVDSCTSYEAVARSKLIQGHCIGFAYLFNPNVDGHCRLQARRQG